MASDQGRAFPIAWALMKSRTTRAYNVVFKALKDHIPDLSPKNIMSDYEKAIYASVRSSFPNARHTGCWFHFSQAIERKSRQLEIKHGEQGGCEVAKRLMATALLPHELIPHAIEVIDQLVESTPTTYRTKARKLLQYFKEEWMTKVTPFAFSVYGQRNRTNNCQETLNRNINRSIRPQGNTWDFWGGLLAISVKEINYYEQLSRGLECARSRKNKWLLQDINIEKLQRKIVGGTISMNAFLTAASHRIATPSPLADGRGDDIEDVELGSLDIVPDIVGVEQPDILDEAVSQEMALRRQVDKRLEGYRDTIKFCQPHSYLEVPTAEFVELQAQHLKSNLIPAEEMVQPNNTSQACIFCTEYASTRLIDPCGHWMGCINCTTKWVMDKHCHQETSADGNIITHNDYPLPIQCPHCNALVGKLVRVY